MRQNPQEFCDDCWAKVHEYVTGVDDRSIITGKYIKKVIKRYERMLNMKDRFVFRTDKVDKVFKFFSLLNIEHKNKFIQPSLMPWECTFISMAFGFYYANDIDKRVVREVFLMIARKNGKTMLASSLQLYFMLLDGVINPQSLLLANVSAQATIALNFAKNMVNHTPELRDRLTSQRSRIIFRDSEKQGFCQTFSTMDPARLEGHSPSCAIADECHAYNDNSIIQAIKTGFGARLNPMLFVISTAGAKNNGFLNEYLKSKKDILDENTEDYTILPMIFQIDEEDDVSDPNTWCKANPSLDYILSLEDLLNDYNSAKYSYADKYFFITKHLNIFIDDVNTWIPEEYVLPCFEDFDETLLEGMDVHIGIDLSKNTDLASIVVYVDGKDMSYAIPYIWMANMEGNSIRKNGKDLSLWIYDKYINKCETKTMDLNLIYDKIIEISTKYNIVSIQYDPNNAPVLVARLKEYGLNCEMFRQNAQTFNAAMKILEEKIYNKKIKMKNPAFLWQFSNVVLYVDGNANIKITKNKQKDSVDSIVSLAEAVGGHIKSKYGDEIMGINAFKEAMNATQKTPQE